MPDPKQVRVRRAVEVFAKMNEHLQEDGTMDRIRTFLDKVPFPVQEAEYDQAAEWLHQLQTKKMITDKEKTRFLDIVLGIMDNSDSVPSAELEKGSKLSQKLKRKVLTYLQQGHNPEGRMDKLLVLLEKHPLTTEKDYEIEPWLDEQLQSGRISKKDYYPCLDILTSEV